MSTLHELQSTSDCGSCHLDVHQEAFDRDCVACHTTGSFTLVESWAVHPTDFPLEGAHLQVTCESCHFDDLGGAFVSLDVECEACHFDAYSSTILVDHQALAFPTECTQCHTNFAWRDIADWDHTAASGGFELGGTHIGLECTECHSGAGAEVPNSPADAQDCIACHLSDYEDEHSGTAFPTECTQCHNDFAWGDVAGFDHTAATGFEIRAAHVPLECSACHSGAGGEVPNPPANQLDCVACHLSDYDDEHSGSGFATECTQCHSETTWGGAAALDHDANYFPIYSGKHNGKWNDDCTSCHTVPGDNSFFTCLQCHKHDDEIKAADDHSGVSGYMYESSFCYSCHMDGSK